MSYYIGDIEFKSQLLNASGPKSITHRQLLKLNNTYGLGGIVTKSFTLDYKIGNPSPNYYYNHKTETSINSIGLTNNGAKYYFDFININSYQLTKPLFLSIAEQNHNNLNTIFNEYLKNKVYNIDMLIEYNVSCPNINNTNTSTSNEKIMVGYDIGELRTRLQYIKSLFSNPEYKYIPFGIKLPPYLDRYQLQNVANVINEFSDIIRFITVCNTMGNGCMLDEITCGSKISTTIGGIGGTSLKPIALGNVKLLSGYLKYDIQIIGCGGVKDVRDVYDFMFAGATFVQIGTKLFENPDSSIITKLYKDLISE